MANKEIVRVTLSHAGKDLNWRFNKASATPTSRAAKFIQDKIKDIALKPVTAFEANVTVADSNGQVSVLSSIKSVNCTLQDIGLDFHAPEVGATGLTDGELEDFILGQNEEPSDLGEKSLETEVVAESKKAKKSKKKSASQLMSTRQGRVKLLKDIRGLSRENLVKIAADLGVSETAGSDQELRDLLTAFVKDAGANA